MSGSAAKSSVSAPKLGDIKLFQKTLVDVIKGIRNHKKDTSKYVSQVMKEIKDELCSSDMGTKAVALQKLTYLDQLGYDMTWGAFHIVEVMSSPKFTHKRIGYLAASLCLDDTTDVTLLTTNLFKKDFGSASPFEVGLALSCLSMIATQDLCHDLVSDVVSKLGASSPYVRKKAVLCLYKIFLRYPDALKPAFPRLKAKLTDDEPCVVSSAVNVICELARKNPQNYLGLAPVLYNILTSSSNNWMIIKVVKLFGALLPLEPRLAKKLRDPLSNILRNTQAKSLLYEAIHTVTVGMCDDIGVATLAAEKVRGFVEDADQNLKFLGLVVMEKMVAKQPRLVMDYKDIVLACLHDADITIREQAVRVIAGMASRRSLREIVQRLMDHCMRTEGAYQDFLVSSIVSMCSTDNYSRIVDISDFEWYVSLLVQLAALHSTANASLIAHQLMDVANRVKGVRGFTAAACVALLSDARLMSGADSPDNCCAILISAAYIVGEFCNTLTKDDTNEGNGGDKSNTRPAIPSLVRVVDALLHTKITQLPPEVQRVYLQNALKVYVFAYCQVDDTERAELQSLAEARISLFTGNQNSEVQERACFLKSVVAHAKNLATGQTTTGTASTQPAAVSKQAALVSLLDDGPDTPAPAVSNSAPSGAPTGAAFDAMRQLAKVFASELLPVSSKAQRKVKTTLDLSQRLFDAPPKIRAEQLKPDYVPVEEQGPDPASQLPFYSDDERPASTRHTNDDDNNSSNKTAKPARRPEHSVFYLGSSAADTATNDKGSGFASLDFGQDSDDNTNKKHSKKHKKSKHKDDDQAPKVDVYVAPKEDDDSAGDDHSSDDDAAFAKTMRRVGDLSRVKEADAGELPQLKHYTTPTAASAKDAASKDHKTKKHGDEHRHHRHHHKSSKSKEGEKSSKDQDGHKSRKDKSSSKDKDKSSSKEKDKDAVMLLDLADNEPAAQEPEKDHKSKRSKDKGKDTEKEKDKSHKHKDKDSKHKDSRKHKSEHRSRVVDDSTPSARASDLLGDLYGGSTQGGDAGEEISATQVVFSDSTLRVTCSVTSVKPSEDLGVDVEVEIRLTNKSSVHVTSASLSDVNRGVTAHCGHAGLGPGAQHVQRIVLGFGVGAVTFDKPVESPCKVSFAKGSSSQVSFDAVLLMPVFSFLVPKPLPLSEYETLMRSSSLTFSASCKVGSCPAFATALRTISSTMRFHVTASTEGAATLYAETVAQLSPGMRVEKVCLMLKHVAPASLAASARSSHEGLASEIIREIGQLF